MTANHTDYAEIAKERAATIGTLVTALEAVAKWRGIYDESDLATWERIAQWFYDDTGYLRPGKDYPSDSPQSVEKARETWDTWVASKNAVLDHQIVAALAFARGDA